MKVNMGQIYTCLCKISWLWRIPSVPILKCIAWLRKQGAGWGGAPSIFWGGGDEVSLGGQKLRLLKKGDQMNLNRLLGDQNFFDVGSFNLPNPPPKYLWTPPALTSSTDPNCAPYMGELYRGHSWLHRPSPWSDIGDKCPSPSTPMILHILATKFTSGGGGHSNLSWVRMSGPKFDHHPITKPEKQGRKEYFSEAKSFFLIFSRREMLFPVENFHFGRPETNFSGFEKWKAKQQQQQQQQIIIL